MPHTVRKRSESGFYHVVTKGEGSQIIFERDADRNRYLELLCTCLDETHVKAHAYCLMSNHVHLLIEDCENELSAFMKRLDESYAMHFRKVTGRKDHVFQGRYWNEAIESDEYFLTALRYIHANPEIAGICRTAEYPWSSYRAYLGEPSCATTELALGLLGGQNAFEHFSKAGGKQALPFPKSKLQRHLSPDELSHVALAILGREVLTSIKSMQPKERNSYIIALHSAGLTEREVVRVTGLGKTIVHRALAM